VWPGSVRLQRHFVGKGNALPFFVAPLSTNSQFFVQRWLLLRHAARRQVSDTHSRPGVQSLPDEKVSRVKRLLLLLTVALSVAAAQNPPRQGPPGAPAHKSPLADYAGTWTGSFEGKTWITVKLTLQGDRLTGFIQHPHDLKFNDDGLLKSVSDDQTTEAVQDAQVNPDGLLLTTKDPDTQETNRFTMKLTGDSTAEIKMSAMKMPPGMPKIKPWKLTKAAASAPSAH
jgi:hypothetical protein